MTNIAAEDQSVISGHDFPPEVDPAFLRAQNPDLRGHTLEEVEAHYELYGRREGRPASSAARRDGFLSSIPQTGDLLEVGPFSRPLLRGERIFYADILTTEEIRAEAERRGEPTEAIPTIHFPQGLAGIDRAFDVVLSSHNIEHHPDLVSHLVRVGELLAPGGLFCLIVPDKRFIFDQSLPASNVAEVIEAHVQPRKVHTLRHMLEHFSLTTHNEPLRHWAGDEERQPVKEAAARLRHALKCYQIDPEHYFDVHAWKFTPESFREILDILIEMDLIPLRILRVYDTPIGANEFCAVLYKPQTNGT